LPLPVLFGSKAAVMAAALTAAGGAPHRCTHCRRLSFDPRCGCDERPVLCAVGGFTVDLVPLKHLSTHSNRVRRAQMAAITTSFDAALLDRQRGHRCVAKGGGGRKALGEGMLRQPAAGARVAPFASRLSPFDVPLSRPPRRHGPGGGVVRAPPPPPRHHGAAGYYETLATSTTRYGGVGSVGGVVGGNAHGGGGRYSGVGGGGANAGAPGLGFG
jgi:hypothetical protein